MLKLGFNEDIDNEDYHADREYLSSSSLKMMLKDPRKFYKVYVENEKVEQSNKSALDLGSYIHARILEPHLVEKEFAVFNGHMRRGKSWDEFLENAGEKIIITRSQKNMADDLIRKYEEASVILGKQGLEEKEVKISSFFEKGFAEQTLCGIIDGIKIKVRFDYRKDFEDFGSINDIKTTSDYIGTKKSVERICANFDYDLSAALYVDLATQVTGKPHDFYFCFLSKKDGACRIFRASEQMLEKGREKYMEAIQKIKKARESGIYFENRIEELESIEL